MGVESLDYGVEIIHGIMGSGKSFFCVRRALQSVEQHRRPLYTNLPMKWPLVKAYLRNRGGEELANLFRRLDESHWRAFLKRQHTWATFREQLSKKTPANLDPDQLAELSEACGDSPAKLLPQHKFFPRQLTAWFVKLHGDHITDGPDANWIPPGAIICIDEAQHWHPMMKQANDPNRADLLAYVTMCRHHVHWLWIITQDPANIAIEWRRHRHYEWRVWNRGEDRLAWGIRCKHIGLRAMGYERATPDQLDAMQSRPGSDNAKPTEKFTILPWLPYNGVFFRLYSSHTHIGSKRQLAREMRQFRIASGLTERGAVARQIEPKDKEPTVRVLRRFLRTAAVLVGACGISYFIGSLGKGVPNAEQPVVEQVQLPPIEWPRWNARGSRPFIANTRVAVGDSIVPGRVVLDFIAADGRSLVLRVDGVDWWLWEWGETQPVRVGAIEDVRAAVGRALAADGERAPDA